MRLPTVGQLRAWREGRRNAPAPEEIINETLREMKERQIRNRNHTVGLITQGNNLENLVRQESQRLDALLQAAEDIKAELARIQAELDSTADSARGRSSDGETEGE